MIETVVEVRSVSKSFGALKALSQVSFNVQQGEFFGLLGANGAGKSTLINVIAGLAYADHGMVKVCGFDVRKEYMQSRMALGIVPQELVYDPFFTVREMLKLQSGYFSCANNSSWLDEILAELKLNDKADENIQSLSGGMKRRVLIAQALVHKPPVLILDEPTAGVDVDLRRSLWRFARKLNDEGHTIILTTHYLEEAEKLCERIAVLDEGELVALDSQDNILACTDWQNISFKIKARTLPAWLANWDATIDGNTVLVRVKEQDDTAIPELTKLLTDSGEGINDLQISKPSLEDAFIDIVSKNRDEL